ncbi:hypothetical protein [Plasmodium yoelii yoelii]|uniref:Uncharacterized protein n=1 Tax=Plasmodium yoelii yoelii TaxID=73239 RepID=Q7R6Y4_PLAYO|nr:hypothetical protein [Plasmodium yoelii yoelii]
MAVSARPCLMGSVIAGGDGLGLADRAAFEAVFQHVEGLVRTQIVARLLAAGGTAGLAGIQGAIAGLAAAFARALTQFQSRFDHLVGHGYSLVTQIIGGNAVGIDQDFTVFDFQRIFGQSAALALDATTIAVELPIVVRTGQGPAVETGIRQRLPGMGAHPLEGAGPPAAWPYHQHQGAVDRHDLVFAFSWFAFVTGLGEHG